MNVEAPKERRGRSDSVRGEGGWKLLTTRPDSPNCSEGATVEELPDRIPHPEKLDSQSSDGTEDILPSFTYKRANHNSGARQIRQFARLWGMKARHEERQEQENMSHNPAKHTANPLTATAGKPEYVESLGTDTRSRGRPTAKSIGTFSDFESDTELGIQHPKPVHAQWHPNDPTFIEKMEPKFFTELRSRSGVGRRPASQSSSERDTEKSSRRTSKVREEDGAAFSTAADVGIQQDKDGKGRREIKRKSERKRYGEEDSLAGDCDGGTHRDNDCAPFPPRERVGVFDDSEIKQYPQQSTDEFTQVIQRLTNNTPVDSRSELSSVVSWSSFPHLSRNNPSPFLHPLNLSDYADLHFSGSSYSGLSAPHDGRIIPVSRDSALVGLVGALDVDGLQPRSPTLASITSASCTKPSPSKRSSVGSVESVFSSSLSISSVSSIEALYGGAQRLSELLSAQSWLQNLSREALEKVSPEEFEENLRRSLVQFSSHLKAEATSPTMLKAASAVRRLARNAANLLRQSLERQAPLTSAKRKQNNFLPQADQEEEEDDDDDDYLNEYREAGEEEPNLELFFSNSVALRLLEENIRLFVHPDPIGKALFKLWPVNHPRDSPLAIEYDLQWEASDFLRNCFAEGQELSKVLTLTGEAINAQAMSCIDYLEQTWPVLGRVLLEGLQEALYHGKARVSSSSDNASFDIKIGLDIRSESFVSTNSLLVRANHSTHKKLISSLSWISAAVRHSPFEGVVYSSALISARKELSSVTPKVFIHLAALERIQMQQACWHPLLPHAVIAKKFPVRHRSTGKGVDISFADMALLSQSMSFIEFDEGLIVEGLRSVLIPIEKLEGDDAIQWHLEYKRHKRYANKRGLSDILTMGPFQKWHKAQEPYELIEKGCFLGWAEEVVVIIGTPDFSTTDVYGSGALPTPKTRRVKSHTISLGASGLGFLGANGSKTWQTSATPSNITLDIDKDIYDTLADELFTTVFIYDTDEKISWLLPQPSVILYLLYKIISRRGYQLFDGEKEIPFKLARPTFDGAKEASSALHELISLKVRKSHTHQERVSRTVKQIFLLLDQVNERLKATNAELGHIGVISPDKLYGVELNDVLEMKLNIDVKQVHADQHWSEMARNGTVVLFCAGFGQPIIPIPSEKLCTRYSRVPPLRNLLATTGSVLECILQHHYRGAKGSRLGDKVEWIRREPLIGSHLKSQTVFHEQDLRVVKKASLDPSICKSVKRNISSGFIFTSYRSRSKDPCSEAPAPTNPKAPRIPTNDFIQGFKNLPEVPDDDYCSEVSNDTGSGFNNELLPTSSISSDESPRTELNSDMAATHIMPSTKITRTRDVASTQQGPVYAIDFPSKTQTSLASNPTSSTQRTIKRKGRCMDLAGSVDKGKGRATDNQDCD